MPTKDRLGRIGGERSTYREQSNQQGGSKEFHLRLAYLLAKFIRTLSGLCGNSPEVVFRNVTAMVGDGHKAFGRGQPPNKLPMATFRFPFHEPVAKEDANDFLRPHAVASLVEGSAISTV